MKRARSEFWRHLTEPKEGDSLGLVIKAADNCQECGVFPFIDWDSEFVESCAWHDDMYVLHESNLLPEDYTQAKVDTMFFRQCLATAQDDVKLLEKACKYFVVIRQLGFLFW